MRSIVVVASLAALALGAAPTDICYNHVHWTSENGMIMLNGEHPFHVKGTSWFGFETDQQAPHGLWTKTLGDIIDFLRKHQFNVLRLPFAVELLLGPSQGEATPPPRNSSAVSCRRNADICHLAPLDLMETIVDRLGEVGILVLLDQHRLKGPEINQLWYSEAYPESAILESWDLLLQRLGGKWNLFGLDLKNEPHGVASWGLGNLTTDWNKAAERIIRHIGDHNAHFQGLFFVNGVGDRADSPHPMDVKKPHWWGGNLEGVHRHPVSPGTPDLARRVVYSPHVYGPDVFRFPYFQEAEGFPTNLPAIWDQHFGFVEAATGSAVVVGEWGGMNHLQDATWHSALARYLRDSCLSDNFYWALNPNSGETGGLLLDNWTTPRQDKLALLEELQPNPSFLHKVEGGRFCLIPGYFAAEHCSTSYPQYTTESIPAAELIPTTTEAAYEEHFEITEAPVTVRITAAPQPLPVKTERPPNKIFPSLPVLPHIDEAPRRKQVEEQPSVLQFYVLETKFWRDRAGDEIREYELHVTNVVRFPPASEPNSHEPLRQGSYKLCPGTRIRLENGDLGLWGSPGVWNLDVVPGSPNSFRFPRWTTLHPGSVPRRPLPLWTERGVQATRTRTWGCSSGGGAARTSPSNRPSRTARMCKYRSFTPPARFRTLLVHLM